MYSLFNLGARGVAD